MKKTITILMVLLLGSLLGISNAMATYINPVGGGNGSENSLQTILDGIASGEDGIGLDAAGYNNDAISDTADSYWEMSANGGKATMIIEIAGWKDNNAFGVYDITNPDIFVPLFAGSASAGDKATLDIAENGEVVVSYYNSSNGQWSGGNTGFYFSGNAFGFYMQNQLEQMLYSDSSLNYLQADHMVAFQGTGVDVSLPGWTSGYFGPDNYILAWEDTRPGGWDQDYNDMVLMIESMQPIPEPATMLLLGLGVLGIGVVSRKKLFKR